MCFFIITKQNIQNKVTQQKRQLFVLLIEHFFQSVLSFNIMLNFQVCAHTWPGLIWKQALIGLNKEEHPQTDFDRVNKGWIQLQRSCNSSDLQLRVGAATTFSSKASCPLTFRLTNLIFHLLFSRGELMSPNICSKMPRHTPSLWMVPATATSTRPWGEARTLRP